MYIVISILILIVILLAVLVIILTLKNQKRSVRDELKCLSKQNNKSNFKKIFMMTLGIVFLIVIAFGIWGVWRLNNTLQSIDTNLSNLDKNTSRFVHTQQ